MHELVEVTPPPRLASVLCEWSCFDSALLGRFGKETGACNDTFPTYFLVHMRRCRLQESEAVRATKEREATTAVADREAMQVCAVVDGGGGGGGGGAAEVVVLTEKTPLRVSRR